MAEVSSEFIYEVLKQIQDRLTSLEPKVDEVKSEIQAVQNPRAGHAKGYSEHLFHP